MKRGKKPKTRPNERLLRKCIQKTSIRRGKNEKPASRREVLDFLKKKLSDQGYFNALPHPRQSRDVRFFEFRGKKYAIKDTMKKEEHGANYWEVRNAILAHHLAARNGIIKPGYRMRSIKALGRLGRFLVMDFIEGKSIVFLSEKTVEELRENFRILEEKGIIKKTPQIKDLIVSHKGGRETIRLPYDFE